MLIALSLILIVLILVICTDQGSKSIISTIINALLLFISLYLIYRSVNPIIVTLITCALISCITLFYQNNIDIKSKLSFLSVIIVLFILIPFVYYIAQSANIEGFSSEQYEITDTNGYSRNIDMNMLSLQISVMIIALIGTILDISVAINTSIYEIRKNNNEIELLQMWKSAFKVSQAVLATSIHTIFYIYIAEYTTLFIQFVSDYSFVEMINSKAFAQEFICISVSGIGCGLIVPISTIFGVMFIKSAKKT